MDGKSGYNPVLEDAVYRREQDVKLPTQEGNEITLGFIALTEIYTQPTEDEVFDYLILRLRESLRPKETVFETTEREASQLESMIAELPKRQRQKIVWGDEELERFIRSRIPVYNLSEGKSSDRYLLIRHGRFPAKALDEHIQKATVQDFEWYDGCLAQSGTLVDSGFGERWRAHILLDEEGHLPMKDVMNHLLDEGVNSSHTLTINYIDQSPFYIREAIDFVYNEFSGPIPLTTSVRDVTEGMVEHNAIRPVVELKQKEEAEREEAASEELRFSEMLKVLELREREGARE